MSSAPAADEAALRECLGAMLRDGVPTEWRERAGDNEAVNRMVARLAETGRDHAAALLRIAGFTPTPFQCEGADDIAQACKTCMYYARHRGFCELPALRLPVEPRWSCRLWRI